MGCASSKKAVISAKKTLPNLNEERTGTTEDEKRVPPPADFSSLTHSDLQAFVKFTIDTETKISALSILRKNDPILTSILLKQVHPLEDVSLEKPKMTTLIHVCAILDAHRSLDLIIQFLQSSQHSKEQIFSYCNIPLSESLETPAILCALNQSFRALYILRKHNLIHYEAQNKFGQTALQVSKKNQSEHCTILLEGGNISHYLHLQSDYSHFLQGDTEMSTIPQNSKIYGLLQKLIPSNSQYEDESFPANIHSILGDTHVHDEIFMKAEWKRFQEIYPQENNASILPKSKLQVHCIDSFGSNSLLGSALTIAEYPSKLAQIFVNKQVNGQGVYSLMLYNNGERQETIIDDRVPTSSLPGHQSSQVNSIWIKLLQKAAAKMHDGYLNSKKLDSSDCFQLLLNCPTLFYQLNSYQEKLDELETTLKYHISKHHPLNAITQDFNGIKEGLQSDTLFTILSLHNITMENGAEIPIIKLRKVIDYNGTWSGDLSPKSSIWNNESIRYQAELTKEDIEQGSLFCMKLEDFQTRFKVISAALDGPDWSKKTLEIRKPSQKASYFSFQIQQNSDIILRIIQQGGQSCHPIEAWIARKRVVESEVQYEAIIDPDALPEEQLNGAKVTMLSKQTVLSLETGEYVVRIKPRGAENKIVVNFCANSRTELKEFEKPLNFMADFFSSVGARFSAQGDCQPQLVNSFCKFYTKEIVANYGSYRFFYCEAIDEKHPKIFKIRFKDFENCKLDKANSLSKKMVKLNDGVRRLGIAYIKPIDARQRINFQYEYVKDGMM